MQRLYEAMFVVDSAKAKEDYDKAEQGCLDCITRHGGEIVKSVKWDERRMCYEINKVRRGIYILVHFNAETSALARIERQCKLSEAVLRVMILVDEDGVETETGGGRARAESEIGSETAEAAD